MTQDEATQIVMNEEPSFLDEAKAVVNGRKTWVCPNCGNGSGRTGDGIAYNPKSEKFKFPRYHCFKCDLDLDNFGWYSQHIKATTGESLSNADVYKGLYSFYGVEPVKEEKPHKEERQQKKDCTKFLHECAQMLMDSAINEYRGISKNTLVNYGVGYCNDWVSPTAKERGHKAYASERIIIPTSSSSYIARAIDPKNTAPKMKEGNVHIFNGKLLEEMPIQPIFITEGEIDALSLIDAGGLAIGLGSTSMGNSLLQVVKNNPPNVPLVLALDNDEAGEKCTKELAQALEEDGIIYYIANNLYDDEKDANDLLQAKGRDYLAKRLKEIEEKANNYYDSVKRERREIYEKESALGALDGFLQEIKDNETRTAIATGFVDLDNMMDGGLHEGLYVIGAQSSMGKTTFSLQVMDYVAKAGRDVLVFPLEMSRNELMAKSISRETYNYCVKNELPVKERAKTMRGITLGERYKSYDEVDIAVITKAIATYASYAGHIYIHEAEQRFNAQDVRRAVSRHKEITGKAPIILVDYLQILAPLDSKSDIRQSIDDSVVALKKISRDYHIPVMAVSSLNRESYKKGQCVIDMTAFKESGAIEYGCDVLIGLQPAYAKTKTIDINEFKQQNPRQLELIILKNRNGATGGTVKLEYYPAYNTFLAKPPFYPV